MPSLRDVQPGTIGISGSDMEGAGLCSATELSQPLAHCSISAATALAAATPSGSTSSTEVGLVAPPPGLPGRGRVPLPMTDQDLNEFAEDELLSHCAFFQADASVGSNPAYQP